jgi:hypothetical protein
MTAKTARKLSSQAMEPVKSLKEAFDIIKAACRTGTKNTFIDYKDEKHAQKLIKSLVSKGYRAYDDGKGYLSVEW